MAPHLPQPSHLVNSADSMHAAHSLAFMPPPLPQAISESGGLSARSRSRALESTRLAGMSAGCRPPTKACMRRLNASMLTQLSFYGGPTVDGIVVPGDPRMLLQEGRLNNAAVVLGANTNDSMLDLSKA